MTTLRAGDPAPEFELESADGATFPSRAYLGRRWLLSFHRYAT